MKDHFSGYQSLFPSTKPKRLFLDIAETLMSINTALLLLCFVSHACVFGYQLLSIVTGKKQTESDWGQQAEGLLKSDIN